MLLLDFFQALSKIYIKPAKCLMICQQLYTAENLGAVYRVYLIERNERKMFFCIMFNANIEINWVIQMLGITGLVIFKIITLVFRS